MDFFSDKLKKYISTVVDISEDFNFEQFKVGRSNITFKILHNQFKIMIQISKTEFTNKLLSMKKY